MTEKKLTVEEKSKSLHQRLSKDPRFRRPSKKRTRVDLDARFQEPLKKESDFIKGGKVDKYGRPLEAEHSLKDLQRFYNLSDVEEEDFEENESLSSEQEEEEELIHPIAEQENVPQGDATHRLALLNLDWDQIKATDIYILLHGFKPANGLIHSVRIYPSQFGKERMAKESTEGPNKDLFKEEKQSLNEEEEEGFDSVQLRQYQLDRLKYYYAVVECDNKETAASIYQECDGREFETSANVLDLRYIPDGVNFDEDEVYQECTCLPRQYKPRTGLVTSALQNSRVKLTWDEDDADRKRLMQTDMATLASDSDLEAYIASASSEDEHYKSKRELLLNGSANDVFGKSCKSTDGDELQVSFESGFDKEATFEIEESEEEVKGKETPFERVLRLKREKKAAKREKKLKAEQSEKLPKKRVKHQEDKSEDEFRVDVSDERFKPMFEDSEYAINPTDPHYKSTAGMQELLRARSKKASRK